MACKIAVTALKVLKEENMAENAERLGGFFREALNNLHSPHIVEVRGKGLLNAIVINEATEDGAWKLCLALKENGLLAKPTHGNKIRFAPPLTITRDEISACIKIIEKSLKTLD